jgi:hypothetical protein
VTQHESIFNIAYQVTKLGSLKCCLSPSRADMLLEDFETDNVADLRDIFLSGVVGTGGITRILLLALTSIMPSSCASSDQSVKTTPLEAGMLRTLWVGRKMIGSRVECRVRAV